MMLLNCHVNTGAWLPFVQEVVSTVLCSENIVLRQNIWIEQENML